MFIEISAMKGSTQKGSHKILLSILESFNDYTLSCTKSKIRLLRVPPHKDVALLC